MSNCTCEADYSEGEGCNIGDIDFFSITTERKKERVCSDCGGVIKVGEKRESMRVRDSYHYQWAYSFRCKTCIEIAKNHFKDGCQMGFLRDSFKKCYGFDYATSYKKETRRLKREKANL